MTVEDSANGRSFHELHSIDCLRLEVIRPTDSDGNRPAGFQLGLDLLQLRRKQSGGRIPWLDEVCCESRTNGFAFLQQRLAGHERRVIAAVIWRLRFIHHAILLITQVQRIKEPAVAVLTNCQIARVVQVLFRQAGVHMNLVLGVHVLQEERHCEHRASCAVALIFNPNAKPFYVRPQIDIGLISYAERNVGDRDVQLSGDDAGRTIANLV